MVNLKAVNSTILLLLLLTSTFTPLLHSRASTSSGNEIASSNAIITQNSLNDYIIVFKEPETVKRLSKKLGDATISFYPIPIIYVKEDLGEKGKSVLNEYKKDIIFIGPNNHYKPAGINYEPISKPLSLNTLNTINATYLHQIGLNGSGIKIAIIDTGISNHVDIGGKIVASKSFIKKIYGYPTDSDDTDDDIGHGTSVAGVAAGSGEGDPDYIGVAPAAYIINAKVFYSQNGQALATDAGIIAAIKWVAEQQADVINLSLGGPARLNDPLVIAVDWAVKKGITVVVAAGNEGEYGRGTMQISTPGVSKYVITVGATSEDGKFVESYSSLGPIYDMSVKPDLLAPGSVVAPIKSLDNSQYRRVYGTSFSAPQVSGSVALLLQYIYSQNMTFNDPLQLVALIKTALMSTASSLDQPDTLEGAGLINVGKAWQTIKDYWSEKKEIPRLFYVLPKKLPAGYSFPWRERIFKGMRIEFNFTFYTSVNRTISIEPVGNITSVFNSSTILISYPFTNMEANLHVPKNVETGFYNGTILIKEGSDVIFEIPVNFEIREPLAFMLFDLRHTSWIMDSKYGQYRHFFELAENMDIAVEQVYWNDPPLNLTFLKKYNLIFMPDTATYYTVYDENGNELGLKTKIIEKPEMEALRNYVSNGGGLIFISMLPIESDTGNNLTNVNEFSSQFGVKFSDKILVQSNPIAANVLNDPYFGLGGQQVPYLGSYLTLEENSGQLERFIAVDFYGVEYTVASIYMDYSGGFIIFSATNFYFDNWSFEGAYGVAINESEDVIEVHKTIYSNLIYKKRILINPMNKNISLGSTVDVNVTIVNINYTDMKVYYRDLLGMIELNRSGQIGPNSYMYTFSPRHARFVSVVVRLYFDNNLVSNAQVIYIEPIEENPPQLVSYSPENLTTIVTNLYEDDVLTFNLTIDEDYRLLPEITSVKAYLKDFGKLAVKYSYEVDTEGKVLHLLISINKRDITNLAFFVTEVELLLRIEVSDVNLNTLSTNLVYQIKHHKEVGVFEIASIVLLIMSLVLIIAILYNYRGKRKRVNYSYQSWYYQWNKY